MFDSPRITMSRRLRNTPFTSRVLQHGASEFTAYNHMLLPTKFVSLEDDYWHLCSAVQVWDVSVERQVSIQGPDATRLVQWMTPRDVSSVAMDQCVYLPLADENGRLVNDPVGLRLAQDHWWLSIADSDVRLWAKGLATGANMDVVVHEPDVWPLAVQGPAAQTLMMRVFGKQVGDIRFFRYRQLEYRGHRFIVARSGWSKQGGFEIYVDDIALGQSLFDELFEQGVGLDVRAGCPNLIERLESGLLAFGNDMDSRHTVLESSLGHFINLDADIDSLSLPALRQERATGVKRRLVGLLLPAPDGPRTIANNAFAPAGSPVAEVVFSHNDHSHCLCSQAWSPRYRQQMASAMLEEPLASEQVVEVLLADGTRATARLCELPFDFAKLGIKANAQKI